MQKLLMLFETSHTLSLATTLSMLSLLILSILSLSILSLSILSRSQYSSSRYSLALNTHSLDTLSLSKAVDEQDLSIDMWKRWRGLLKQQGASVRAG